MEDLQRKIFTPAFTSILHGQVISVLIAGTGVFATILSDSDPNANFPLFMGFLNYGLLSLFLLKRPSAPLEAHQADAITFPDDPYDREVRIPVPSLNREAPVSLVWYFVAAIFDVEANFLVLLAYNYTTITSVMLLDCFTIPCAMLLSYFILGCRYSWKHLVGAGVCLSGLICIVINDSIQGNEDSSGSDPVLGDILCLCGAILYACSNIFQEVLVKFSGRDRFRGYLGGFGMIIAGVQCLFVDLPGMERAEYSTKICLSIFGFVACLFLMYINTSAFLQSSDATLFNLSLLTSDVYAVIFSFFFYGHLVQWPYFLAFGLVICGLALYHSAKPPLQIGRDQRQDAHPLLRDFFRSLWGGQRSPASTNKLIGAMPAQPFEYNPIRSDSGLEDGYHQPEEND